MIVFEPGFSGTAFPLDRPRIAAHAVTGTAAASTAATGFSAAFAANLKTNQFWRPTAVPATWDLTYTSQPISYIAVAGHDCATVGATLEFQRWDGAAWVTMLTHTPTDNSVILALLTRRTMDRHRVRVTGAIATIAVISAGDVIEVPQKATYIGATSFEIANQNEYRDTVSDGGHVLDRFLVRRSIPAKMEIDFLSEAWCDTVLTPLRAYSESFPIFIADRPLERPASVAFGFVSAPIQPQRSIPNQRVAMKVAIEVTGNVSA